MAKHQIPIYKLRNGMVSLKIYFEKVRITATPQAAHHLRLINHLILKTRSFSDSIESKVYRFRIFN